MDNKQLYLLWGIIIAFILVALFPPMDVTSRWGQIGKGDVKSEGDTVWRFIFANSKWQADGGYNSGYWCKANHIKVAAWTIEFIVLGVVSAGLWFTFQRKG